MCGVIPAQKGEVEGPIISKEPLSDKKLKQEDYLGSEILILQPPPKATREEPTVPGRGHSLHEAQSTTQDSPRLPWESAKGKGECKKQSKIRAKLSKDNRGEMHPCLGCAGWVTVGAAPGAVCAELGGPWPLPMLQFVWMPWKCLCQQICSFIVKEPISFCFLLLWEFIPPSDLQYKSASLTEIDTAYMKSSECLWARRPFP